MEPAQCITASLCKILSMLSSPRVMKTNVFVHRPFDVCVESQVQSYQSVHSGGRARLARVIALYCTASARLSYQYSHL